MNVFLLLLRFMGLFWLAVGIGILGNKGESASGLVLVLAAAFLLAVAWEAPSGEKGGGEMAGEVRLVCHFCKLDRAEVQRREALARELAEGLRELGTSLRRMSKREADMFIVQAACDALASKAESLILKAKEAGLLAPKEEK